MFKCVLFFVSARLLECLPLAIRQHYVVGETTQIYKTMISLDSYIYFASTNIKTLETKLLTFFSTSGSGSRNISAACDMKAGQVISTSMAYYEPDGGRGWLVHKI